MDILQLVSLGECARKLFKTLCRFHVYQCVCVCVCVCVRAYVYMASGSIPCALDFSLYVGLIVLMLLLLFLLIYFYSNWFWGDKIDLH